MNEKSRGPGELLKLLETPELPALGPQPRASRSRIGDLEQRMVLIFADGNFNSAKQNVIRALIYLWHDHLDESHTIAQDIHNADGSFVHGIMHRREPDASNAKYWFHRVGRHRAFPEIANRVRALLESWSDSSLRDTLIRGGDWDPFGFIDACEEARRLGKGIELLQRCQEIETRVLLEHLCR